jgi:AraC-like DNA-binding protein/quercetin dioxygenase-like cupin family protein
MTDYTYCKIQRLDEFASMEVVDVAFQTEIFPRHFHDTFTLGLVTRGSRAVEQNKEVHVAPAGSVILIAPGVIHAGYGLDQTGWRNVMLYPSAKMLSVLLDDADLSDVHFMSPVIRDRQADSVMRELIATLLSNDSRLRRETIFAEAGRYLLGQYSTLDLRNKTSPVPSSRLIARACDYLHAHFRENIALEQLAEIARCSRLQLIEQFNRHVGMPPHSYQIQLRVQLAQQLLRRGQPIVEVAAECGFFDQSHLNRHFKKHVGLPPTYYRSPRRIGIAAHHSALS